MDNSLRYALLDQQQSKSNLLGTRRRAASRFTKPRERLKRNFRCPQRDRRVAKAHSWSSFSLTEEGSEGWKIIPRLLSRSPDSLPPCPPAPLLLHSIVPSPSNLSDCPFPSRFRPGRPAGFLSFSPDSRVPSFSRVYVGKQGARYFRPSPTRNAVPGGVFRTGMVDGGRPALPRFVYTERRNGELA